MFGVRIIQECMLHTTDYGIEYKNIQQSHSQWRPDNVSL